MNVLLFDEDAQRRAILSEQLRALGFSVSATEAAAPPRGSGREPAELALVTLDGGAAHLIARLKREDPLRAVVVLAHEVPNARVLALLRGVHDVLVLSDGHDLSRHADRLHGAARRKVKRRERALVADDFVGDSDKADQVRRYVQSAMRSDSNVLITGESGTGKEILARAIHAESNRGPGPYVAVNCAAMTESLLESELFGHEKGAFTGAERRTKGKFEQAHGGTLFLDEIGEMPLTFQAKLLRVLQSRKGGPETLREITRVGAEQPHVVDVRLIFATHRDLEDRVDSGLFREDLLQRLNVIHVRVPPLRERFSDLRMLAEHFLSLHAEQRGRGPLAFDAMVMELFLAYEWPRNVRELENVIKSIVALKDEGSVIVLGDLPSFFFDRPADAAPHVPPAMRLRTLDEVIDEHVLGMLAHFLGNKSRTARQLGLSRPALDRRLDDIQRRRGDGAPPAAESAGAVPALDS